ncbi:hypothetical protein JCM10296v2_007437 [Rhodotorula toruloides]
MDLPHPPRAVINPSSAPSSPFPSRPPSPVSPATKARVSYAYPPTPEVHSPSLGGSLGSTPAQSRSGSLSKNPLLKRAHGQGRGEDHSALRRWIGHALGVKKDRARSDALELEEQLRGRSAARRGPELAAEAELAAQTTRKPRWKWTRERAQLAVGFAMIALVGMNDSATGANLDSMQAHYRVSYDEISIVFLANTAGYFLSSISASFFLHHCGLQVSLLTAAAAMATGCVVLSVAPPFPAFIIMLGFMGFGSGMYDAVITTVIAHEEDGVLMSLLYSCFGVGAMISPLAIGAFLDRGYAWNRYYNIPLGLALILAVIGYFLFRGYTTPPDETHDAPLSTSQAPAQTTTSSTEQQGEVIHARARMSAQQRMKRAMGLRAVWIGFVLIICAFASSDILSAWSVSFLITTRSAPPASSRFVLSGLWMGIASGRVVLAWLLANRVGEKTFAIGLLVAASGMLGVLYVRSFVVDAVALAMVGFFFGPVTPKVLDVIGVRVPPSLKASVVSLLVGLGLIGSSVGPLLFGVAAGRGGLSSLPAVLIGVSVLSIVAWCAVPKNRRRED